MGVRCAVVGYSMGRLHADHISRTAGLELAGICDTDPAKRALAEADRPAVRTWSDIAEVLADESVDLIVLVTPHDTHCPLAIRVARAGKHVITDKVMCLNAREAERMIAAAEKAGVLLSVFQNRRWDGDFLTVRSVVEDGVLGKVFQLESAVVGWGRPGGWRGVRQHCGGGLLDWGAHLVDQANLLADSPPVRVHAAMRHPKWDVDIETHHRVWIEYASGMLADIETSYDAWVDKDRWRVLGDRGGLVKKGFGDDPARIRTTVGSLQCSIEMPSLSTRWEAYYANIAEYLAGKAELQVRPEQCLRAMRVFDAAYASHARGRAVRLSAEV